MDTSLISAVSALAGAAIGGVISLLGSLLVQRGAARAQWNAHDRLRRQDLYKEFIDQGAKCYIEALQRDKPEVSGLVVLYAHMSRMRVVSSPKVLAAAHKVLERIASLYAEPQVVITNERLRAMIGNESLDVLREFSETCREETAVFRA